MQAIDQWAIEELGIPGAVLMENAGGAIVRQLQNTITDLPAKKIIIFGIPIILFSVYYNYC